MFGMVGCGSGADAGKASSEAEESSSSSAMSSSSESAAESSSSSAATSSSEEYVNGVRASLADEYQKFLDVQLGMTETEVEGILGTPDDKEDESGGYVSYDYELVFDGEDADLEVHFNPEGKVWNKTLDILGYDFKDIFGNGNVDLSGSQRIEDGEVTTYDEVVELYGDEGILITEDDAGSGPTYRYVWYDANGGSSDASFREDGSLTSFVARY